MFRNLLAALERSMQASGDDAQLLGIVVIAGGANPETEFPVPRAARSLGPLHRALHGALHALSAHKLDTPGDTAYEEFCDAVGGNIPDTMSALIVEYDVENLKRIAQKVAQWMDESWFESPRALATAKQAFAGLCAELDKVPESHLSGDDIITEHVDFSVTGRRSDVEPFMAQLNRTTALARVRETLRLAGKYGYRVQLSDCGHLDLFKPDGTHVGHYATGLPPVTVQKLMDSARRTDRFLRRRVMRRVNGRKQRVAHGS